MSNRSFDWDDANRKHLARHKITPEEAEEVFSRFYAERTQEPVKGEPRYQALGTTAKGRPLTIAYTERDKNIRPITGWDMKREELEFYVEELYRQTTEI